MHNTGIRYNSKERMPTVLSEMAELLPPLSGEQLAVLEADLLANGCYAPVIVNEDIWRLQTHAQFGGTWLSDYVPNRLGGFVQEQRPQRPKMELLGQDGNIFAILGRASALLKRAGMKDQADEMFQRVTASGSYEQALNIISEYVETELTPPPIHQKSNKKKARDAHER